MGAGAFTLVLDKEEFRIAPGHNVEEPAAPAPVLGDQAPVEFEGIRFFREIDGRRLVGHIPPEEFTAMVRVYPNPRPAVPLQAPEDGQLPE